MARYEFKLPDIGEGIAEAEIVAWHVAVGDMVAEDQQLADMMTDKATVEVAGAVGDMVPIGSVLVVIETEGAVAAAPPEAKATEAEQPVADGLVPAEEVPHAEPPLPPAGGDEPRSGERGGPVKAEASPPPAPPASGRGEAQVQASPAVRARARDLGIDLARVRTTGDRVRHADLDAYLLYNGGTVAHGPAPRRADEDVKVVGLRRKIAENMAEAKRRVPHFTLVEEYDVTALEETRAMMNADRGDNPKLTMLPFLITAMARALADFPQINARYDDEANVIHRSGAVHMGMATQTDSGLAVPVIRNAERRDLWDLAAEIVRLAEATRAGKAARDELSGSTITISSLGPWGGIASTPVINRPEVAILAVNKVREAPVVADGELEVRKLMNLSISCDHRVVDGWDAALFMQALKGLIENPLRLLAGR
jgi:2-oxoisovalerate dehydrogenase E2 component (dihydrolipoyl transacylase)